MQSLNVKLRRFTLGLGVVCGLNLLLVLLLFMGGKELMAMYAATLLIFWIPVTVGSVLFRQELETTLDNLTKAEGDFLITSYPEQGQLSVSAD
jgi:hypothetical protein